MKVVLLLFHLTLLPLGPCLQGQLGIVLGLRQGCGMRWFYQQDTLPTGYGGFTMKHMGVSENSVPLNPLVLLIIIPIKWL